MNIRVTSITLALLLILNSVVLAETTTQFTRDGHYIWRKMLQMIGLKLSFRMPRF